MKHKLDLEAKEKDHAEEMHRMEVYMLAKMEEKLRALGLTEKKTETPPPSSQPSPTPQAPKPTPPSIHPLDVFDVDQPPKPATKVTKKPPKVDF